MYRKAVFVIFEHRFTLIGWGVALQKFWLLLADAASRNVVATHFRCTISRSKSRIFWTVLVDKSSEWYFKTYSLTSLHSGASEADIVGVWRKTLSEKNDVRTRLAEHGPVDIFLSLILQLDSKKYQANDAEPSRSQLQENCPRHRPETGFGQRWTFPRISSPSKTKSRTVWRRQPKPRATSR